jgi:hypothetical protein
LRKEHPLEYSFGEPSVGSFNAPAKFEGDKSFSHYTFSNVIRQMTNDKNNEFFSLVRLLPVVIPAKAGTQTTGIFL